MAAHSGILDWRIPWTEEPGELQSGGPKESDRTDGLSLHTVRPTDQEMIFFEKIVCYSQFQGGGAGRAMQCHMKKHQGWLGGRRNKEKARAGRLIVVFHGKKWLRQGKQAKQVWDWLVWISSASSGIYNLSWAIWFLALGWLKAKNYCLEFKSPVKLSHVQLFATPWTVACQASLSMEFSSPEY